MATLGRSRHLLKVVTMLFDKEETIRGSHCLYAVQLSKAVVKHDHATADWIADEILLRDGFLIPRSGTRIYGFRSEPQRERALNAVRSRFGWTCVEPVEIGWAAVP